MSQRYYKDWLQAFVDYASFGEAPLKMIFWTGVSTIAGALRRRVWIDQKYFQWLANFYILFVAPPGVVSKTTTANIGMNLLRGLPAGSINFGPDVVTWQALITSLAKSCENVPDPTEPGTFYPMSAVTFCSDELGNLLNPDDQNLVSALITLWDGKQGAFEKETKTSGSDRIENPWANIIGCTTPAWMSGNFPEWMMDGGLPSRFIFIYADQKRQLVPFVDEVVPKDFDETKRKLIHDLELISMMFGNFKITEPARVWSRNWYKEHWATKPTAVTKDMFTGYMARKQTHLFKLAMVISASAGDTMEISELQVRAANDFITAIERDMPRVFARVGLSDIIRGSTEILFLVENRPGITQAELYRTLFRTLPYKDFVESLNGAINSLQIHSVQEGNALRYYPVKLGDDNEHQTRKIY